jgi:hypothetical protein
VKIEKKKTNKAFMDAAAVETIVDHELLKDKHLHQHFTQLTDVNFIYYLFVFSLFFSLTSFFTAIPH